MIASLLDHLAQTTSVIKAFFAKGNGAFQELLADDKDRISQLRCVHFFLLKLAQRYVNSLLASVYTPHY